MRRTAFTIPILLLAALARASYYDWHEGTMDADDGATRDYYNRDALLSWNNYMGDWTDKNGTPQGDVPYAVQNLADNDTPRWVEWDVTELASAWAGGTLPNRGMLLRDPGGSGSHRFRSREYTDESQRPRLVLTSGTGEHPVYAAADTYLETSTYQGFGDSEELRGGGSNPLLLRFDLTGVPAFTRAALRLYDYAQYGNLPGMGVYACSQGNTAAVPAPTPGLSAAYPADAGIDAHPDVLFAHGFEQADWQVAWTSVNPVENGLIMDAVTGMYAPLSGKSVRSTIPQGSNGGMTLTWDFADESGSEPEEIYWRYYLRLGDSWTPSISGGKLPGVSGTYGVAGWGGRRVDGTNGWSARGLFVPQIGPGNPLGDKRNPVGFYCYHADMPGTYGDNWIWSDNYMGYLANNRWYAIEQYVRMNTPGVNDGILRTWVNGVPAFEKTDIRFRDVTTLKIERIWMNVYHGGSDPAPHDMHLYFDNVVIAKSYIGPGNGLMASARKTVKRARNIRTLRDPATGALSFEISAEGSRPPVLEILDVMGRKAAVLRPVQKGPSHVYIWNGETSGGPAAAGVYFVRIAGRDVYSELIPILFSRE